MRHAGPIILLLVLGVLWLFPGWFGFNTDRPIRTVDGDKAIVRDGDTLAVAGQDFRLYGIDAPEYQQTCKTAAGVDWDCGRQARTALAAQVKDRTLTCKEHARDQFGRIVATCTDDQGNDVGGAMIDRGLAVHFGEFGDGPYAREETIAKAARRGIWQGRFEAPSAWRAAHPRVPVATR